MLYQNIANLIKKPLSYLFSRAASIPNIQHQVIKTKKNKQQILSAMDLLIFRQEKPNTKFLDSQYGVNARLTHDKMTMQNNSERNYEFVSTSHFNKEEHKEQRRRSYSTNHLESVMLLPFLVIGSYKLSQSGDTKCFFGSTSKLRRDIIQSRVVMLQYAANNPIEDRYKASQLTSVDGYIVSVFDGHGGWQVAELAMKKLHDEIDKALKANANKYETKDDWVQLSLKEAFEIVEQEFIVVAREAYQLGFANIARVGACALTAVVIGDTLYSANLGDCKGIIVNIDDRGISSFRKINHMLNANSKKEQVRLRTLFAEDEDIVVCRKGNGSCYVKNRLQPTRALGDLRLKFNEFNNPQNESKEKGYAPAIDKFTGPYISAIPDQKVFKLQKGDRYLIMGSDGLWDELTKKDIAQITSQYVGKKDDLIKAIFQNSFTHAAQGAKMTEVQLREIPLGKRRKLHDDITIIVVDLENQI